MSPVMQLTASGPLVVIIDEGSGGLGAAGLRRWPVQVTLVDRTNHHLFQPLLYQAAIGLLSPGEVAPPLRVITHRQSRLTMRLAEVTGVDVGRRVVELCDVDGVSSERVIVEGVGGGGALAALARASEPAAVTTGPRR